MKPLYCPYRSGYLSLIFQVQQLGITRLTPSSKSAMCPNGILAVGCIPIGSVVILVMGHYYKFLSKHSSNHWCLNHALVCDHISFWSHWLSWIQKNKCLNKKKPIKSNGNLTKKNLITHQCMIETSVKQIAWEILCLFNWFHNSVLHAWKDQIFHNLWK